MECWFTENQSPNLRISCRVTEVLHREKTPYQEIAVYETPQWGRLLTLDDVIMTTDRDEFVYHEMMAHIPLCTHPAPRRVLVIGGGDGGVVREVLKHPVEAVSLVEIDGRVIDVCREYFPAISCGLSDPRVTILVDDGIAHVARHRDAYDVIIVDSTDPVGPAVGLFREEFYRSVAEALTPDGLFVAQTESPFYNASLIQGIHEALGRIFPITRLCYAGIPTYPSGFWTISMGSKRHDPLAGPVGRAAGLSTRYYSPEVHRGAFALPPFVQALVRG